MMCFKRAKLTQEQCVAKAYYLREQAQTLQGQVEAGNAFVEVAEMFSTVTDKRRYFGLGAECLDQAERYAEAAEYYLCALRHDDCVNCYYKMESFELVFNHSGTSIVAIAARGVNEGQFVGPSHVVAGLEAVGRCTGSEMDQIPSAQW